MSTIPVFNPTLPYLGIIPGGLQHGKIVQIGGILNHNRFNINIQSGAALKPRANVNLHISIRPTESAIVRNHYENNMWGVEERFGPCPIQYGQHFDIMILAQTTQFKIAVNGTHFCTFNHRLPLNTAQFVSLDGDATVYSVKLEGDVPTAPPMPYPPTAVQPPIHTGPTFPPINRPIHTGPTFPPVGGIAVMPGLPGAGSHFPGQHHRPIYPQPPPSYPGHHLYPQPSPGYPAHGPGVPYTTGLQQQTYSYPANNPNIYPANADSITLQTQTYYLDNQEDLKKKKRKKALKIAAAATGIGLGAYVVSKAMKGSHSDSD